jgi:hypothetical protein
VSVCGARVQFLIVDGIYCLEKGLGIFLLEDSIDVPRDRNSCLLPGEASLCVKPKGRDLPVILGTACLQTLDVSSTMPRWAKLVLFSAIVFQYSAWS